MSKKAKYITSIITIAMICLIGFFSYQSYVHTNIKNSSSTVQNTEASKKGKHQKQNKQKKDDSNIFLQDKNNPDRIIAIHPNGTNGIYQYRKQANGDLYPEFKFFNGKVTNKNGKLTATPNDKNSAKSFSYDVDSNGNYHEAKSNSSYEKIETVANKKDNQKQDVINRPSTNKENIDKNSQPKYHISHINSDYSNPSFGQEDDSFAFLTANAFRLNNNDYVDPINRIYYGNHFDSFDVDNLSSNPLMVTRNNRNDSKVMFWKQNGQTTLSQDEIDEDDYYNLAYQVYPKTAF